MKLVTGGAVTYYHTDRLNSTAVVTNAAGTPQESIQYYPFGEQWTDTGTANVPYKYTGQEYDATTGLYFYKARYYDPHLGRFIQPDTMVSDRYVPAAWNRYAYALNNPLKHTDPTGHFEEIPNTQDWSFANGLFTPDVSSFALNGYVYAKSNLVDQPSQWGQQGITNSVNTYYNVINGMGVSLNDARDNGISQVTGYDQSATQFTLWHNPSEGLFLDLLESAADKLGITTQIAKQTASLLSSNPQSLWFLHSQGSLIFSSAVSYLNEKGVSLSNVSAVFNGAAANQWVTGMIMAQAGVTIKEWNAHPGDFVHDVIGLNTINPLRLVPSVLMLPTLLIEGSNPHCCYP
jgi:RHS repeat-associated protein